jgi:hypothetical protein
MKKKQNTTSAAWTIFRRLEVESGRKFTAADRKGKDSKWAEAMRTAYQLVATEIEFGLTAEAAMCRVNRLAGLALSRAESNKLMEPFLAKAAKDAKKIDAVRHMLVTVPKYDQYSLDYTERSESRRREANDAASHNQAVILKAIEEKLTPEQEQEANELGLSVKEYHNTAKRAKSNDMSVKEWCLHLEAEEAEAEEKKRVDMEQRRFAWLTEQNNKKVAAMRSRYARRRY